MKNFEFDGFFRTFKTEFLPKPDMTPGTGAELDVNADHFTLENIEKKEKFITEMRKEMLLQAFEAEKADKRRKLTAAKLNNVKDVAEIDEIELDLEADTDYGDFAIGSTKADIQFKAAMLGGLPGNTDPSQRLIADWNVVSGGKKVEISYETFLRMSRLMLDSLYDFCTAVGKPEKKPEDS